MPKKIIYFSIIVITCLLSACNSTKYLSSEQRLVKDAKITFKTTNKIEDKSQLVKELTTFIQEKPNGRLFSIIPKEYIYLSNSQAKDTLWYHKSLRSLGEKPSVYHEDITVNTAKQMEDYLRLNKGFYEARVDFLVEEPSSIRGHQSTSSQEVWQRKSAYINYIVAPGRRYTISSITYQSEDTVVLKFIQSIQSGSFVKVGDYIDYSQFEIEKSRITLLLQNAGFANFSNNYIDIQGDSSQTNKTIDIIFDINLAENNTFHKKYTTGTINVYTDYIKGMNLPIQSVDTFQSITFYRMARKYVVKPTTLTNSIFLREGQLLERDDRLKTFRKLNGLGSYRFVTINPILENNQDTIMDFDIFLTPYQNKWIFDGGLESYFSTLSASRLLGVSVHGSFQNRNLLGGSEKYTMRAELGTELSIRPGVTGFTQRTKNIAIQNTLNIPSFSDFGGIGKLLWRAGLIRDKYFTNFREEATTNIGLGFSSLDIINFYSITSFNATYGFDYTSPRGNRYIYRPLGLNLDLYTINDSLRFADNPLIFLSFKDNLGTGFLFRDFQYIYNSGKSRHGNSFLVINNFEVSGWEIYGINKLYNTIFNKSSDWTLPTSGEKNRNITFAKYIRYEFDGRYYKEFTPTSSLATRVNFGIIVPFGENSAAPFIRQFGVGGPSSLRAWNVKEAGPGSYYDPLIRVKEPQTIFVNQGDIKIETNVEYRFKMFLILDGAFFVDAGNVWTLKDDPERPGAVFSSSFLNQVAVGAGYGLRLNFNFFNIRFDFGYKIRSPFVIPETSRQWYTFREIRQQGLGNVQVAINYPF